MYLFPKFNRLRRSSRFRAQLRQAPLPLLDGSRRTVVSWSAKSACTHVVIWYLYRVGLLEEARSYHTWVHRYRGEVLYQSDMYQRACDQLQREGASKWTYVKVVRDPVRRCVSSYRHALKHGYEDEKISRVLERDVNHVEGYSYETFLEYLCQIDLQRCDIHHRIQKHSLDTVAFGRTWLINIDEQDLDAALTSIDRIQACAPEKGDRTISEALASAADRHAPKDDQHAPEMSDLWRTPLSVQDVRQWPKQALLSARPPAEIVRRIYSCDYDMLSKVGERSEPV